MLVYIYTCDYEDSDPSPSNASKENDKEGTTSPETAESLRDISSLTGPIPPSDLPYNPALTEPRARTEDVSARLLNNVLVYAIADKYGISELQYLAKAKFRSLARSNPTLSCLGNVVRDVYSSTPDTNRGLRDLTSKVCATQISSDIALEEWQSLMLDVGNFSFDLFKEVMKLFQQERAQWLAEQVATNHDLEESRRAFGTLETSKTEFSNKLDHYLKAASQNRNCTNCSKTAGGRLHRAHQSQGANVALKMGVRCFRCQTLNGID